VGVLLKRQRSGGGGSGGGKRSGGRAAAAAGLAAFAFLALGTWASWSFWLRPFGEPDFLGFFTPDFRRFLAFGCLGSWDTASASP